jgi:EmrB/QacA subfamily drug resistance transporter
LSSYVLSDRLNPKITVGIVFVLGLFVTIMDTTIVNVALPTLAREFHIATDRIDGVVVGFLVSLAVVIPASGWVGDRFGSKRVFLFALSLFTAASALCGVAQSFDQLVAFRILQGVGGGMLTPVGMAMLYRTYPQSERVRASRILVLPTALAPALGPVVGGLLVTDASWRWVFYVNVPIGIVGVVFGALFLKEHVEPDAGSFDLPGFILAGAGFASLMFSLSEGPSRGWTSPLIIGLGLLGLALLAVLVRVELHSPAPLIYLQVLRDRLFRTTTIALFLGTMGFLGVLYLVALFYQDGLGLSALGSGLSTFPEALGVMVGAQFASRAYSRVGPRRLMIAGLIGVAATTGSLALVSTSTSLWAVRGVMLLLGVAMANVFTPGQAAAFAGISGAATGRASTLFNASRQLGSALGVAVLSTVIAAVGITTQVHGRPVPHLSAYHWGFLTAAALALVAAAVASRIDDGAAAATMQPKQQRLGSSEPEPELAEPLR